MKYPLKATIKGWQIDGLRRRDDLKHGISKFYTQEGRLELAVLSSELADTIRYINSVCPHFLESLSNTFQPFLPIDDGDA